MRAIPKATLLLIGAAACHPAMNASPSPEANLPTVTVRQVLTTQALVGETVMISGRCVPDRGKPLANGTRPIASRAWQLEDNGVAVWVSGAAPAGCEDGTAEMQMIIAQVQQDSLPHLSRPRMVRQYLVVR